MNFQDALARMISRTFMQPAPTPLTRDQKLAVGRGMVKQGRLGPEDFSTDMREYLRKFAAANDYMPFVRPQTPPPDEYANPSFTIGYNR